MYVEAGKRLTVAQVRRELSKAVQDESGNGWSRKDIPTAEEIDITARMLYWLNVALLRENSLREKGRQFYGRPQVFAVLEKAPPGNLDTGRHYWSVWYIRNGTPCIVWPGGGNRMLGDMLGMIWTNKRLRRGWNFGSGAIGMSRLMDATDRLFYSLKSMGGCYAQISEL